MTAFVHEQGAVRAPAIAGTSLGDDSVGGAPGEAVDCRVSGVAPDLSGLMHWTEVTHRGPAAGPHSFGNATHKAIGPAGGQTAQPATGHIGETAGRADNHEQKGTEIRKAIAFGTLSFTIIRDAATDAISTLSVPEIPKTDLTKQLLGMGVGALLGAGAGAAAAWFLGSITTAGVAAKGAATVASLVGGAVKNAMGGDHTKAADSLSDVSVAFQDAFKAQINAAERDYIGHWSQLEAGLALLTVDQLESFNSIARGVDDASLRAQMKHQTFIAWTNFLARVKHGAMGPWDHWTDNGSPGAIALPGAQPKPTAGGPDPARNNISRRNHELLETGQRTMQDDPFGVLEIFVWATDAKHVGIVDRPGYRMRLDNVGPKVREEFRSAGRVRNLPVNKVVHVCSHYHDHVRVDPPTSIASLLITADGYVRAHNWGLTTGIATFASAAQELPLSYLEV